MDASNHTTATTRTTRREPRRFQNRTAARQTTAERSNDSLDEPGSMHSTQSYRPRTGSGRTHVRRTPGTRRVRNHQMPQWQLKSKSMRHLADNKNKTLDSSTSHTTTESADDSFAIDWEAHFDNDEFAVPDSPVTQESSSDEAEFTPRCRRPSLLMDDQPVNAAEKARIKKRFQSFTKAIGKLSGSRYSPMST